MTYSIVAKDKETGMVGVIVASRFFAAGAMVPYMGADFAIASQSRVNPLWGTEGRQMLAQGESAQHVLNCMVAKDEGRATRQCHMLDQSGQSAAFTGDDCIDFAGHEIGDGFSVAGNMLAGEAVVQETARAYRNHMHQPFAERLMTAMEAGEAAGGDKRGKQSAGLVIHRGEPYPWLDIRADDHEDPLAELRRLYDVAQETYLIVADYLPTQEHFSGRPDEADLEGKIEANKARREQDGKKSQSRATGTEM
ncbi:DUF1028 domain-containing protein [Maritalea mediterranea]|uniref:DUF1028 domain-containing protein n=1 Tax=Maritalea mediterranea TaxID=2909667 RepID=A0ABS9E2N2_9HYPH|nr:DUF1028 domain-containing protein [Maritalea mediterranea]MCF4097116.1 DUF1028 domain-containing protein [Maritalea mediterranea]